VNEVKKCPKCSGKMVEGSDETLDDAFRCTRPKPRKLKKYTYRIESYCCESCGYIEFYKEKKE